MALQQCLQQCDHLLNKLRLEKQKNKELEDQQHQLYDALGEARGEDFFFFSTATDGSSVSLFARERVMRGDAVGAASRGETRGDFLALTLTRVENKSTDEGLCVAPRRHRSCRVAHQR